MEIVFPVLIDLPSSLMLEETAQNEVDMYMSVNELPFFAGEASTSSKFYVKAMETESKWYPIRGHSRDRISTIQLGKCAFLT